MVWANVHLRKMIFLNKLIFVFCIVILFKFDVEMKSIKLKLVSIEKCPGFQLNKDIPLIYTVSARKVSRKKTLISTNFTLTARAGPVFFTFRGYQQQQNAAKDLVIKLERMTCKNPITFQLVKVVTLRLTDDCYVMPGNYSTTNINIEDFSALFAQIMVGPGLYAFDLEFLRNKDVAACIAITADISELK